MCLLLNSPFYYLSCINNSSLTSAKSVAWNKIPNPWHHHSTTLSPWEPSANFHCLPFIHPHELPGRWTLRWSEATNLKLVLFIWRPNKYELSLRHLSYCSCRKVKYIPSRNTFHTSQTCCILMTRPSNTRSVLSIYKSRITVACDLLI